MASRFGSIRSLLVPLMFMLSSVASLPFEKELYEGFVMGLVGFDKNGDHILTRAELAFGILTEPLENTIVPWEGPSSYPLGRSLCKDPYPDSVSLNECLVAEARESPSDGLSLPISFDAAVEWYAALCDVASWRSGDCLDSCSQCRLPPAEEPQNVPQSNASRHGKTGVDILITSDWHIEPWYKYSTSCGKVCRTSNPSTSNMWKDLTRSCKVNGKSDPPLSFGLTHLTAAPVASTKMLFFSGDGQAHSFQGFSGGAGKGVQNVQDKLLDDVLEHYDAENVVWANGNNDGPHYAIFKSQDSETKAYAQALLSRNIVTDALGIKYSGGLSQTQMFAQTGFYCKKLPLVSDSAYAIVYNTILGGSNKVQQAALKTTLEWITAKHGSSSIVYFLGHQPSITKNWKTNIVDSKYHAIVKGAFAGHIHMWANTDSNLFTQCPGITQAAGVADGAFWIARGISAEAPNIVMSDKQDLYAYGGAARSKRNQLPDAHEWCNYGSASSGSGCSHAPTPTPTPPAPTPPAPTPPAPTPPSPTPGKDTLECNVRLHSGDSLTSASGNAQLVMQGSDGNLVLYNNGKSLWSSKTGGHAGAWLILQCTDGNLVLRGSDKKALWASGTNRGAVKAVLLDDCNLQVMDSTSKTLWSTKTTCTSSLVV